MYNRLNKELKSGGVKKEYKRKVIQMEVETEMRDKMNEIRQATVCPYYDEDKDCQHGILCSVHFLPHRLDLMLVSCNSYNDVLSWTGFSFSGVYEGCAYR